MDSEKPKLVVVELWGLGDLIIATPFLQAASRRFLITLLAKPYAQELADRFWPQVRVVPFVAPWTAFRRKYRVLSWPWREILELRKLGQERFAVGLSARWDPRDHFVLRVLRARRRLGFPRLASHVFLTDPLARPETFAHRYEYWQVLGRALSVELPPRDKIPTGPVCSGTEILVHTGAGQPVRVWPLDRYARLVRRLRQQGHAVQVACDPEQQGWWRAAGEAVPAVPRSVRELLQLIERAALFVGNDSGPGHLAAASGVPTFTLFGPQLPEWFAPLHPGADWLGGKPCPYKPCSDYCHFPAPNCLWNLEEEEVWSRLQRFISRHLQPALVAG